MTLLSWLRMIWTCGEAAAIRMRSSFVIAMGATGTVIAEPLNAPEGKAKAKDDSMATVGALASEDMAVGGASCLDCHTAIDCLRCERCGQNHRSGRWTWTMDHNMDARGGRRIFFIFCCQRKIHF